ncbi:TPA: hypothetical protein HA239_00880 [Candidatus Woesearchaeota archaeon]|nr:hypothetical protein [Candidatus Woesearchaeota archaeon]
MVDILVKDLEDYVKEYSSLANELLNYKSSVLRAMLGKSINYSYRETRWAKSKLSIGPGINHVPELPGLYLERKNLDEVTGEQVVRISGIGSVVNYLEEITLDPEDVSTHEIRQAAVNSPPYLGIDQPDELEINYGSREELISSLMKLRKLGRHLSEKLIELQESYKQKHGAVINQYVESARRWRETREEYCF